MVKNPRVQKYRKQGAGADLVRVEVLVPAAKRDIILLKASTLRAEYRASKTRDKGEECDGWNK